jgi:Outer membrane protein beta-barrel domain
MNRVVSAILAVGVLAGVSAAPAACQGGLSLGVGGGVTLPLGDFKDAAKTGWHGLANLGWEGASGIGLRGDFYYGENSVKDPASGKFKLAGGLGNVTYSFSAGKSSIRPYVIGGAGFFNGKADVKAGGVSFSTSSTKFAWAAGGGVKFKAGSDSDIFLEGRYVSVSTSGGKTNFIPVTLGVRFGI